MIARLLRHLREAFCRPVVGHPEPLTVPDEVFELTQPLPDWHPELTSAHERTRIRESGKQLAREARDSYTELRVVAREQGIDL